MKYLVLLPFVILLLIPIQAYADHASIITDKTSYSRGDPIEITGLISEYITSPVSAEIKVIDPVGSVVLDKEFMTDTHGKIDAFLSTNSLNMYGTYKIFCTNCDHGIYFSFDGTTPLPKQVKSTTSSPVTVKQPITPMNEKSLINLYTKLNILVNNNEITYDNIGKVTQYLLSVGYTNENTLDPILLKVVHSSEVMRNTPTFVTVMHSCTHIDYSPTVYMEGFIKNNADSPHTVIFRFEILDKNNNLLNFKESDTHQMGASTEWDGADYVTYDPMFDHCDIHVEMIK